jgi:hypothetical protein
MRLSTTLYLARLGLESEMILILIQSCTAWVLLRSLNLRLPFQKYRFDVLKRATVEDGGGPNLAPNLKPEDFVYFVSCVSRGHAIICKFNSKKQHMTLQIVTIFKSLP